MNLSKLLFPSSSAWFFFKHKQQERLRGVKRSASWQERLPHKGNQQPISARSSPEGPRSNLWTRGNLLIIGNIWVALLVSSVETNLYFISSNTLTFTSCVIIQRRALKHRRRGGEVCWTLVWWKTPSSLCRPEEEQHSLKPQILKGFRMQVFRRYSYFLLSYIDLQQPLNPDMCQITRSFEAAVK